MVYKDCSEKTDAEVVRMALADDSHFECLVGRYEQKLGRYVRHLGAFSKEEVEDILQEAFIKVYKNLNGYDPNYPFSAWVYRIAHNEAISHFRKISARPAPISFESEEGQDLIGLLPADINVADEVPRDQTVQKVRELIYRLPEKYRAALVLNVLEDKSYDEVAAILRIPSNTVATHVRRAKLQFKELAEKHHLNSAL